MGHEILDDDKCAFRDEPAWHKLGKVYTEDISATQAHDDMGGSYTLYKKPVGVMFDDHFIPVHNQFAIVRGKTNKDTRELVFGYATDHYHLVQPIDIIQKFDEKVGVSIETLGFIQDGRKMFLTWKLPSFEAVAGDEINLYGSVMMGFDTVFSSRLNILTTRIVCSNTFAMALGEEKREKEEKRGRGTIYSSKHTNSRLLKELGEWMGCIHQNATLETERLKALFGNFAKTPIVHEQQAKDLIYEAFPNPAPIPAIYPDALRAEKQNKIDEEVEKLESVRGTIFDIFTGSQGIAIDDTYYGLFNATTQFFNHVLPSKKDTAYSLVWGNRNIKMNQFAKVLSNSMKK